MEAIRKGKNFEVTMVKPIGHNMLVEWGGKKNTQQNKCKKKKR
jgi:hypothetical protein